jgi:enolase
MPKIQSIKAISILDSRGFPTVQVVAVVTNSNSDLEYYGKSSSPSGASTGTWEALELRDGAKAYSGKGVQKAVDNINNVVTKAIVGLEFDDASQIDKLMIELDGTNNKSRLGANATLAVSNSLHRCFAKSRGMELWQYLRVIYFNQLGSKLVTPRLMCNIINGGAHADNGLDFQEFMIIPKSLDITESVRIASEIYHTLKSNLSKNNFSTA